MRLEHCSYNCPLWDIFPFEWKECTFNGSVVLFIFSVLNIQNALYQCKDIHKYTRNARGGCITIMDYMPPECKFSHMVYVGKW